MCIFLGMYIKPKFYFWVIFLRPLLPAFDVIGYFAVPESHNPWYCIRILGHESNISRSILAESNAELWVQMLFTSIYHQIDRYIRARPVAFVVRHRIFCITFIPLQWRQNERDCVSDHHPHDCLLNRLFRRKSKKTSKLRVTGLRAGNSPMIGDFPARTASNAESVSIWWRHHVMLNTQTITVAPWFQNHWSVTYSH